MITWDQVLSNRKKWIEELKNPEAKQAFGILFNKREGSYCGLGHGIKLTPCPVKNGIYSHVQYFAVNHLGLTPLGIDSITLGNDLEHTPLEDLAKNLEKRMKEEEEYSFSDEKWFFNEKEWKIEIEEKGWISVGILNNFS